MPRKIEITLPPDRTDALIERVQQVQGVTSVSVQRGVSIQPPGDTVSVVVTNDGDTDVVRAIQADGFIDASASMHVTQLRAIVTPKHQEKYHTESSELTWEETGKLLEHETNPSYNYLLLMLFSGTLAAGGIVAGEPIAVIGAMVIAPGFEPFVRIPHGLVARQPSHVRLGLWSALGGYLALFLGGALTMLLFAALGAQPLAGLENRYWVQFWVSLTPVDWVVGIVAGAAGALTVSADRPVLTAGAMIALSLVPAVAIAGMALASLDFELAGLALGRWLVDALLVAVASVVVLGLKSKLIHKRPALA